MAAASESAPGPFLQSLLKWPGPVAVIAFAQLLGTSLWFSANSATAELMNAWDASASDIGMLTSAVQLGFILGTLTISMTGYADRFRPSLIFVASAIAGAAFNAAFAWLSAGLSSALVFRFLVGMSLAGIYPLGMKLIVSWEPHRTGAAFAQLVGMLSLGTALPHGLRFLGGNLPWQGIITGSSLLAVVGALFIYVLGDGPYLKQPLLYANKRVTCSMDVLRGFSVPQFRAAAFGYFGHMWELYAFWTIVPLYVSRIFVDVGIRLESISGLSFLIVGCGAIGCIVGGTLSRYIGSARVAAGALALSGLSGLIFVCGWRFMSPGLLVVILLVWGVTVVADSPQFSSLSANACAPERIGGALAIQNSIGFAITVVSIALVTWLFETIGLDSAWILLPGPTIGLLAFLSAWRGRPPSVLAESASARICNFPTDHQL
ncbi:MFS transporter [Allopusillimonas ginsengisoli]|uniref:MFS transporter n=1 Tax=Allopusillimonas ginsengisoli TaxID=453575 RepID=UPI0010C1C898|nr:MFS transporter [Allopusillimonas ginsengisoli]